MIRLTRQNVIAFFSIMLFNMRSMPIFFLNPTTSSLPRVLMIIPSLYFFIWLTANRKVNKYTIIIIALYCSLFISTVLFSGDYLSFYSYAIQAIGVTLLCNYFEEKNTYSFVKICRLVFVTLVIFNFFVQLIVPQGIPLSGTQTTYLVGSRIGFTTVYCLGVFCSMLCDYYERKRISLTTVCVYVVCFVSLVLLEVSTGIIALTLIFIFFICSNLSCLNSKKSFLMCQLLSVLLCGFILFANNIKILKPILDFLGEDLTFNNRTDIWNSAITYIIQKPILGHGITSGGDFPIIYTNFVGEKRPAHNNYLHILYEGGFLSFIIFLCAIIYIGILVKKCNDKRLRVMVTGICTTISIISISEIQMQRVWVFYIWGLCVCALNATIEREKREYGK